jgi:diguanylate cyclase (GGDEF)-like protein
MYSLYFVLTDQHGEEFAPLRCDEQTLLRLVRYFEDVVTENKLSALVIEGRCLDGQQAREAERAAKLAAAARHLYLFTCNEDCRARTWSLLPPDNVTLLEEPEHHSIDSGPFILIMDTRFCGMLASYAVPDDANKHGKMYEMVWTFDANVVFTAIEYLMARMSVQSPCERERLSALLDACTPHAASLRMALTLTTKLTMLMQRRNELEMAINRISSAISNTLELESILQSAVEEVGTALKARRAAIVLWQEGTGLPEGMSVYELPAASPLALATESAPPAAVTPGPLEAPITYRNSVIGVLAVEDDAPGRNWEDEEVRMVQTVSDQLAVAISHARLFSQVQMQARTDSLTGLYNHRYLQERLEREVKLADRNNDNVSLILLDLDHLKRINDTLGHRTGDAALRHVAAIMQKTVREVDVCVRYGGEEFVILLPQCSREDAISVAERLRESIASSPLQRAGQVTASIGVATYPLSAKSKDELIEMADRAMYLAKAAGRNRVRTLMRRTFAEVNM